jgi:hypothetical protein
MRRKNEALQGEINQLRELLGQIDHGSEAEVLDRPQYRPGPSELLEPGTGIEPGNILARHSLPRSRSDELFFALEDFDSGALSISELKVHARPWTVIAGDGLVSEAFVLILCVRQLLLPTLCRSRMLFARYAGW